MACFAYMNMILVLIAPLFETEESTKSNRMNLLLSDYRRQETGEDVIVVQVKGGWCCYIIALTLHSAAVYLCRSTTKETIFTKYMYYPPPHHTAPAPFTRIFCALKNSLSLSARLHVYISIQKETTVDHVYLIIN